MTVFKIGRRVDSRIDIVLALKLARSNFYVVRATLAKLGPRAGNTNFHTSNE